MMKNDFYVGYFPKAPKPLARWLRRVIATLILVFALLAIFVAGNQGRFARTNFEYGQPTELKGVVSLSPVPRLIIETGRNRQGIAMTKSILLVNFGKSGVMEIFRQVEKESGRPLADLEFTLSGSLIYGEGKVVFELTGQRASILAYTPLAKPYAPAMVSDLGTQSIDGEIIDPKCYFGVMKPGFGKVHRSCAIRCIAGGISPVMATKDDEGHKQFILLAGKNNTSNNDLISRLAGKPLTISGQLALVDDWLVLNYDEQALAQIQNQALLAGPILLDQGITLCN